MSEDHAVNADTSLDLLGRYRSSMLPLFAPSRVLTHGDGAYVYDAEGTRYLDLLGGIAVNALGHNHPALVSAANAQVARAIHISNLFASPQQIELAEKLLSLAEAPEGSGIFFTNSGAESNEAAFKIARRTGKTRIIALEHSFHGRTMGALALTHKEAYRAPFSPLPGGVEFIPAHNPDALEKALAPHNVAAVIAEPIQGEAGVLPLDAGYLRLLRQLTSDHDALLILDEVQTGIGRTGAWFAHQLTGIKPDVMTLAKGLGGGYPMGAVVTFGERCTQLLSAGQHGTTFGGNPLGAAMALAVLETIERDKLLAHANEMFAHVSQTVAVMNYPGIEEVRGSGLLIGIRLAAPLARAVVQRGLEHGFILNAPDEYTLRLAPALIVTADQLSEFLRTLPTLVDEAKSALEGDM